MGCWEKALELGLARYFFKNLRNITVKCRAMKDLLYSVDIFTNYTAVLGLFKCIFRKPQNFLCNMKLGSRVIG